MFEVFTLDIDLREVSRNCNSLCSLDKLYNFCTLDAMQDYVIIKIDEPFGSVIKEFHGKKKRHKNLKARD